MKLDIYLNITKAHVQLFTGIDEASFERLIQRIHPVWTSCEIQRLSCKPRMRHIGGGGKYRLGMRKLLFMYLFYCRHYVNQYIIASLCHLNQSNVSRLFKRLEQVISQSADPHLNTVLDKLYEERIRTGVSFAEIKMRYPGIEKVITDVTEIRCNKPKNAHDRARKFSGKRKQCSLKKQVSIAANGRILATSRSYAGRVHDISIERKERILEKIPKETFQPLDLGYIGIRSTYPDHYVVIPPKKRKNRRLSRIEQDIKRSHSRERIPIEHSFSHLKRFNILKLYRGPESRFDHVFDNIAALHNLQITC